MNMQRDDIDQVWVLMYPLGGKPGSNCPLGLAVGSGKGGEVVAYELHASSIDVRGGHVGLRGVGKPQHRPADWQGSGK
ncbi:hypothetical protein AYJ70_18410 [Pseudomonas monteilii]|uniref:Uncharacterized protein n=1 Tax=Pseudomonas monteilii TaxID=76759 RepID=A0AAP7FPZ9_9PSED|nr:hypothetical protein AYJ70_18410 [Pseudomonas monteilii]